MPETVRLYHFMRVEHALQAIERRRLKIAELDKVNDPFECLAIALNSRKDEEFFLSYQRDIAKEYGVVCFSETCQDPSLWGHYADRFRGICLGFDTAFHGDDEEDLIGKVNYVQKRIDTGKFRDLLTYFKSSNSLNTTTTSQLKSKPLCIQSHSTGLTRKNGVCGSRKCIRTQLPGYILLILAHWFFVRY